MSVKRVFVVDGKMVILTAMQSRQQLGFDKYVLPTVTVLLTYVTRNLHPTNWTSLGVAPGREASKTEMEWSTSG